MNLKFGRKYQPNGRNEVSNSLVYKDQIWLCTNLGLINLDEKDPCASQIHKYNGSGYITSYAVLFEDRILVSTDFNGLLVFDLHHHRFSRKFSTADREYPLLSNRPIEVFDFDQSIGIAHRDKGIQFSPKAYIRSKLQFANDGKMSSLFGSIESVKNLILNCFRIEMF